MDTRECLKQYREFLSDNPKLADEFLRNNSNDQRFVFLIRMREDLISSFSEHLKEDIKNVETG